MQPVLFTWGTRNSCEIAAALAQQGISVWDGNYYVLVVTERLGFEPVADPEKVLAEWRSRHPGARVGVMAGGAVYPKPT